MNSFESSFRRSLSAKTDVQLVEMIAKFSLTLVDVEREKQAAPRLKAKWRITSNELRKRRLGQAAEQRRPAA